MTRSCLKSIRDKGPNKVRARHKTYSPVRQLGGHSWDHRMPHTHRHAHITHTRAHTPIYLWVGEAIMPQITTWLIVSEQMSRLSEIWACLVCKLPSQVLLNLLIRPPYWELYIRCSLTDIKRLKRGELANKTNKRNYLRCSLLCKILHNHGE